VRIYDDKLIIRSPGFLPYGITLEELYKPHSSTLRNKGLAEVLYDTELIERWGSGIEKIQQHCLDAGLSEPTFEEYQGFQVVFRKSVDYEEYLRSLNLNERQLKAVIYVKEKGQVTNKEYQEICNTSNRTVTNKEYQEICNTSNRTASRDLADLVSSGLLEQIGITGKGTAYILRRHKDAKDATKAP
jgi:ATP-dependent DNA helicase RecG